MYPFPYLLFRYLFPNLIFKNYLHMSKNRDMWLNFRNWQPKAVPYTSSGLLRRVGKAYFCLLSRTLLSRPASVHYQGRPVCPCSPALVRRAETPWTITLSCSFLCLLCPRPHPRWPFRDPLSSPPTAAVSASPGSPLPSHSPVFP